MIRIGKVSSISQSTGSARVIYPDTGAVSAELQVMKTAWPLTIGEQVVCLLLPTGNQRGFVLGTFYTASDQPPYDGGV